MPYKQKGFPKHKTKSHLNQNEEPDWDKILPGGATGDHSNLQDTSHLVPEMSEDMKKLKEQYPDVYEVRYGSSHMN